LVPITPPDTKEAVSTTVAFIRAPGRNGEVTSAAVVRIRFATVRWSG
jgi:hypothetical protein